MKRLFFTLLTTLSITSFSFAQDTKNIAVAQSSKELVDSKVSGNYKFTLPESVTAEDVAKNSKYYVHYFTVEFDDNTQMANIKMISNDDKSRHVVTRFLTANQIQSVQVDGKPYSLEEFFNSYLK